MPDRLHLDGVWPAPVTLRKGWAKAVARPWNNEISDASIRLERGSSDFLRMVSEQLGPMGSGSVYSPALYPSGTRVWTRAGFARFGHLEVMERPLGTEVPRIDYPIETSVEPDWSAVTGVDRLAFDGFWRMSEAGLVEAMRSTPRAVVLLAPVDGDLAGYAVVGSQMSLAFLQRVAVDPVYSGQGIGTSLIRAAQGWAGRRGARVMVLNLRPENHKARYLYEREGFHGTDTLLQLLRFEV